MTTYATTVNDLRLDLPTAASAAHVRSAISRVEAWWSSKLERSGDDFTVYFDHNWTRVHIDGNRWTVTAQDTPALPVSDEWVGDTLTFDVEGTGPDTSVLHFTHHGLLAQQCAADCQPAWQHYLASLVQLAETGAGNPWHPGHAPTGG